MIRKGAASLGHRRPDAEKLLHITAGPGLAVVSIELTKTTPVDVIEEGLVTMPDDLALARFDTTDLRVDPALIPHLEEFHRLMVEEFDARADGLLVVNSCYRRRGTTCETDYGGAVDLSDINGHWTGRAIDFSAEQTAVSFFGSGAGRHRDEVRKALYAAGFRFPWYYKGREIDEHWHVSIEVQLWAQSRAFRGEPPPWYS
jgi:hypothetical protein